MHGGGQKRHGFVVSIQIGPGRQELIHDDLPERTDRESRKGGTTKIITASANEALPRHHHIAHINRHDAVRALGGQVNSGNSDVFLLKLDSNGNVSVTQ